MGWKELSREMHGHATQGYRIPQITFTVDFKHTYHPLQNKNRKVRKKIKILKYT